MTFPREGKFTSSHFFASKDVMGTIIIRNGPNAVSESMGFRPMICGSKWGEMSSQSSSQSSPSLPQNSVSCLFRNSTHETIFCPFPKE